MKYVDEKVKQEDDRREKNRVDKRDRIFSKFLTRNQLFETRGKWMASHCFEELLATKSPDTDTEERG